RLPRTAAHSSTRTFRSATSASPRTWRTWSRSWRRRSRGTSLEKSFTSTAACIASPVEDRYGVATSFVAYRRRCAADSAHRLRASLGRLLLDRQYRACRRDHGDPVAEPAHQLRAAGGRRRGRAKDLAAR